MRLVTTGTTPQRAHVWNSAVRVPNAYLDTSEGSLIAIFSAPFGLEVHTPPCLTQNEQVQARAGISAGSGSQRRENEMFPQWHLPWINKRAISVVLRHLRRNGKRRLSLIFPAAAQTAEILQMMADAKKHEHIQGCKRGR